VSNKLYKHKTKIVITILIIAISIILLLVQTKISKRVYNFANNIDNAYGIDSGLDAPDKKRDMLSPVVKLSMVDFNSKINGIPASDWIVVGSATGVSIGYDKQKNISYLLTNNHFCEDAVTNPLKAIILEDSSSPRISDPKSDSLLVNVLKTSEGLDLCLTAVTGYIKPATLATESVNIDQFDEIYIIGGPTGIFPTILDTYVSGNLARSEISLSGMHRKGNDFVFISGIILPGHSGSPVYNKNNEMIGLVFATVPSYGALAISIKDIYYFIEN
jgi:S1-C subfamily serine protease